MSNYFEIVETAFREILASGLSPFVKREMKARYGANWVTSGKISLQSYHVIKGDLNWSDMQAVLKLITNQWHDIFKPKLGDLARDYVYELIDVRNSLKHESRNKFDFDYSYRALDTIERLLSILPNDRIAESKAREATNKKKELLATLTIGSAEKADKETEGSRFRWHEICGVMLLQKQRDSLRRKATQVGAEVNVYLALDLLKTEERSRNDGRSKPDKESKEATYEIERTFKHDDFLESLTQRQSKNKHIAITGEAGAGKTTFLVTIAEKLKDSQFLPIFIGLADLQGRSLKTYINDVWLPHALNEREATEEQKESLFQQFQAGKIWLLLDALDEMQAKSSAEALDKINREIKEVIGQSRVVMTCRLNVWDAYINRLPNFDTFRMGNLSFEQIDSFISQWFSLIKRPKNASILQEKLKEPKRDRIRDMVRHPLRLALLCQAFYQNPNADLPETKAGLYELFVRYFYEWKPNIVDVDLRTQDSLREALHQALGKLAIKAIDSDAGFRLSRSFAVKAMGSSDLFNLACNVGWLSLIDRNDQDEEVYSFFHATFQEYFAALVIDDHSFLFSHVANNPLEDGYRVFQSKWKEVFLLWLGKSDNTLLSEKQLLMSNLFNFNKDGCDGIYIQHSQFLVGEGTREFYNFDEAGKVIDNLIGQAFGCWNKTEKQWQEFSYDTSSSAIRILTCSHKFLTLEKLYDLHDQLINALQNVDKEAFNSLFIKEFPILQIIADISEPSEWLVSRLIHWLEISTNDGLLHGDILDAYQKVCTSVTKAIRAVEVKISDLQAKSLEQKETIRLLRDTTEENETELHPLNWIKEATLQQSQSECYEAIAVLKNTLAKIDPNYNVKNISQLHKELNQCESDTQKIKIIESILRIDLCDPKCEKILNQLSHSDDDDVRLKSYLIKLKANQYNEEILQYLVESLDNDQNNHRVAIAEALIKSGEYNQIVFEVIFNFCFNQYFSSSDYYFIFVKPFNSPETTIHPIYGEWLQEYKNLFKGRQVAIDFLVDLIKNRQDGYTLAIEFLQNIVSNDNHLVKDTLVNLIESQTLDSSIRVYTATVLNNISYGHPASILFLHDYLDNEQYQKQVITSLLNANFSVLNENQKSLLENNLLSILDNRTEGESSLFLLEIATLLCKIHPRNNKAFEILFDFQNPVNLKNFSFICYSLRQIGVSDSEIIDKLTSLLSQWQEISQEDLDQIEQRFGNIFVFPIKRIDDKIYLLHLYNVKRRTVLYCLSKFGMGNKNILTAFISEYLLSKYHPNVYSDSDRQYIKKSLSEATSITNYKNFLDIWKSCDFKSSQVNENLLDHNYLFRRDFDRDAIQEALDRNTDHPEIRCLVVDICHLEQESDPNVVAEEIAIKIFDSLGRKIPEIQRVSSLKRELLRAC